MEDYLVFRLYGSMAAWGDVAVGEYRPSFAHPSKSAIIGLLAAALGIRRDDDERQRMLFETCRFGVRVDAMGSLVRDYHTTQVPPEKRGITHHTRLSELASGNLNTILSTRDYYCDAVYTVAVSVRNGAQFSVKQLADALLRPVFTLYLGRKSCPTALPLQPCIVSAATLKDAFRHLPFPARELSELIERFGEHTGIYWESELKSGYEAKHIVHRRDVPTSRRRWQFTDRHEHYASVKKEG